MITHSNNQLGKNQVALSKGQEYNISTLIFVSTYLPQAFLCLIIFRKRLSVVFLY